jgi:hypothetical protein
MTDKEPVQRCLIFEPIDYSIREESVDFVVKETARERARRLWRMKEPAE